jgi:hypothetical protein
VQLEPAGHPSETQPLPVEPYAAKFSEAECFPSALAPESGKSGLSITRLQAMEKSLKSIVQPLERPTLKGHGQLAHFRQCLPAPSQRFALIDVGPRRAGLPVTVDAFLKRGVVQLTLCRAQPLQCTVLALERQ